jgi:hypothetical protein
MADFDVSITDDDRDLLARIVATEADHRYASSDPDTYNAMVAGIVDTVLNRVASPSFPDTVEAVANQKNQFSAINGPKGRGYTVWKDVRKVPDSLVTSTVREAVNNWVDQRIMGTPSSVGGGLHYGNPNYSDEKNKAWIEALTGPRIGAGVSLHYHGTSPGYKPKEASVTGLVNNPNSSFAYENGLGLTTSSGKFLGLAPLLNQKKPGSNVTRSIIGDIPVIVRAKPKATSPATASNVNYDELVNTYGWDSVQARVARGESFLDGGRTGKFKTETLYAAGAGGGGKGELTYTAPSKKGTQQTQQARQTATLPSGKTVEVGRIYTIAGQDFIGGVKDGKGVLTPAPKSIIDEGSGKSAVGGIVRDVVAKETGKAVRTAVEGAVAAAPGVAKGVADSVGKAAGDIGALFGGVFGGQEKGTRALPAPKPLSFPAIIPNLVTKKVNTVKINPLTGMPSTIPQSQIERSPAKTAAKQAIPQSQIERSQSYQTILKMTAPVPVKGKSSAVPQPGVTYENLLREYQLFGGKEVPKTPAPQKKSIPQSIIERTKAGPKTSPGVVIARPQYDVPFDRGVVSPKLPARRPDTVRSPSVPQKRPSYSPVSSPSPAAAPTPAAPAYQTTQFQQDRFQTTEGATMPSSMNNSRWTTGY